MILIECELIKAEYLLRGEEWFDASLHVLKMQLQVAPLKTGFHILILIATHAD